MSQKVQSISDRDFEQQVLSSEVPVLLDFYADWCPPCRRLAPILDGLAQEYEGRARILKINTETQPLWASRLGVTSLPTMIFFKNGEPVAAEVGLKSPAHLRGVLDKLAS